MIMKKNSFLILTASTALYLGCDPLTHPRTNETPNTVSSAAPPAGKDQKPDLKNEEQNGESNKSKNKISSNRDAFFKAFEGKYLEINTIKEGVNAKGCLFASRDFGKCRWHLKGNIRGNQAEVDLNGTCNISEVPSGESYQLDIFVTKINKYETIGEEKIVNAEMDEKNEKLKKFSQTNIYSGTLVSDLPDKVNSIVSGENSPTTIKWVSDCKAAQ